MSKKVMILIWYELKNNIFYAPNVLNHMYNYTVHKTSNIGFIRYVVLNVIIWQTPLMSIE